ncbi:MAG: hypothetical protein ABIW84_01085 [Ilumatobacteraceae bacterium]
MSAMQRSVAATEDDMAADQLCPEPFPYRVLTDEHLQATDRAACPAVAEFGVVHRLECLESQFLVRDEDSSKRERGPETVEWSGPPLESSRWWVL